MGCPADGLERPRERRIRDRERVKAKWRRRAECEYPDSRYCMIGAACLQRWRASVVRHRFRPRGERNPLLEPDFLRTGKAVSLQDRREQDAVREESEELELDCRLPWFRD